MKRLARLRSALRRVLPGKDNQLKRVRLRFTAENEAGRGKPAETVFRLAMDRHGDGLDDHQRMQLLVALERDLPAPPAGMEVAGGG